MRCTYSLSEDNRCQRGYDKIAQTHEWVSIGEIEKG
jgi:hypothetical protein